MTPKTLISLALIFAGWTLATWGAVWGSGARWVWPLSYGALLLFAAAAIFVLDYLEERAKLLATLGASQNAPE